MKELYIRDVIGWHTTASKFGDSLKGALDSGEKILIKVNSGGGSVFHGLEIADSILTAQNKGADITLRNISLAGSMATFIMSKAKKGTVEMDKHSMYFVHLPSGISFGNEEDMKKELKMMASIGDIASDIYSNRTRMSKKMCLSIMKDNLWATSDVAKKLGFVDRIVEGGKETAKTVVPRSMKDVYSDKNTPEYATKLMCFDKSTENGTLTNNNQSLNQAEKAWMNLLNYLG